MPVVLRVAGYKFFFYQADVANEAKFWLEPVKAAREGRFRKNDLRDIERIIENNLQFLLNAWNEEKSKHVHG